MKKFLTRLDKEIETNTPLACETKDFIEVGEYKMPVFDNIVTLIFYMETVETNITNATYLCDVGENELYILKYEREGMKGSAPMAIRKEK